MNVKMFLPLILAVICSLAGLSAKSVEIIDSDGDHSSISKIADVVCQVGNHGEHRQISRLSTIGRLVNYLESQDNLCREQYLDSLIHLNRLIELDDSNVCHPLKIQAIEDYNRRYVTKVTKHKKSKKAIPKVVEIFFMHYATFVSSKCEQTAFQMLLEALELMAKEEFDMDETVNSFADALGISETKSMTYDSLFLTWNLIENLPLEKSDKFARNIQTGPEKMFIEMREPENMVRLQGICNNRLRPLYFNTLLPVMRLVDIGYYPDSDSLMKQLNTDSLARSLYLSVQFCETLLPIQVLRNNNLAENHVAIVPIVEAKKISQRLRADGMEVQKVLEPKASIDGDSLESIRAEDAKTTATAIKMRVKSRGRVTRRALLKLARAIKSKLASSKRRISISSEDGRIEGVNEAVDSAVANMEEEDLVDSQRRRRESTLYKVLMLPIRLIGVILYPLVYVLLELPYRWIYKKRLIPIRVMDTSSAEPFYWYSYSVNRNNRTEEWEKMMADRWYEQQHVQ